MTKKELNTSRHYEQHIDMAELDVLQQYLKGHKQNDILTTTLAHQELTVAVKKDSIVNMLMFLRDDMACKFTQLQDICGVDYSTATTQKPEIDKRYGVVYHLLSLTKNMRIRLRVLLNEGETVPTATTVFSSANWFERECYDMFGIRFEHHPDMRRLLCDYEFDGHPLKKDFPLMGTRETYYDKTQQRVAYKAVDMPQEFRQFDQQSRWQGMTGNGYLAEEAATISVFDKTEFEK